MVFSPFGGLIGEPRDPFLAMAVAIAYLPMALALLLATRRDRSSLAWQACVGVGVDIIVAALITHAVPGAAPGVAMMLLLNRSEEHTSELQSLMRISYAVFCLNKKKTPQHTHTHHN